jgi:phenylpyruvate tautomerase PptA (4-oxalocrotonate tautomerase family)
MTTHFPDSMPITRRETLRAGLVATLLVAVPAMAEPNDRMPQPALVKLTLDRSFEIGEAKVLIAAITSAIATTAGTNGAAIWVQVLALPSASYGANR